MSRNRDIAQILGKTEATNTTNIALGTGSGNLEVYQTLDNLPSTSLTSGDQAFIESSGRLYISNGSGWYNVALINASPSLTLDQSGTIQLNNDTLTVTVTASATDSDDNQDMITFSVESDGNMSATGVTVSQDSSVFTITSLTQDSGGVAGDFTLTFKATDGIAVDNEDLSFSLAFSNVVDSSAETSLLMKATLRNNGTNAAITYFDSSETSATDFTEVGNPHASTFSPYRSGGYSYYFPGDGGDYFEIESPTTALSFGTGDFCIEMWIYPEDTGTFIWADMRPDETNGSYIGAFGSSSGNPNVVINGSTIVSTSGTPLSANEWHHLVLNRDGTDMSIFIDGVREGTATNSTNLGVGEFRLFVNAYSAGGVQDGGGGYIRDYRVVKGDNVYGSGATCTVPTETLTAITGTSLLMFTKPYLNDEVGTESITFTGGETNVYGPYDYEPWSGDDHGGSVNFDGSDALENTVEAIGTSDFTFEGWVRITGDGPTNYQMIFDNRSALTTGPYGWYQETDDKIKMGINSTTFASDNTVAQNTWYHWALVRSSNACTFYLNGDAQTSNAGTSITTDFTGTEFNIGRNSSVGSPANGDYFIGDQADFRYSKSARYTSDFTPPTAPLAQSGSVMLMNNKGGTYQPDASIYDAAAANTFLLTGNAKASTGQRKFTSAGSVYFDGTGDRITVPSQDSIILGSGDFTIEFWMRPNNHQTSRPFGHDNSGSSNWSLVLYNTGTFDFAYGTSAVFSSATSYSHSTWTHVAWTREGNTARVFINGTLDNTNSSFTQNLNSTQDLQIGYNSVQSAQAYAGYIQDFRITKGLARYTATFTAPTAEFEL